MSDWQRAQIETRQHQLSYQRSGGNKLPLVLIHNFAEDSSTWKELATTLEPNYDIIMLDLIGHGESSRLPADGKVDLVQDLADFINALGLQKTGLIGDCFGAEIVAEYTAQNPEKVAVLAMEEVPWIDPALMENVSKETYYGVESDVLIKLSQSSLQEILSFSRKHHPTWNENAHAAWASAKLHFDPAWLKVGWKPQIHWEELAAKITCHALIMNGEARLGSLLPSKIVIRALKIMPALEWSNVAGAGHTIHYDKPVPYNATVKNFLAMNYAPKKA